eukprot:7378162-Prymnesium_polylepis.1
METCRIGPCTTCSSCASSGRPQTPERQTPTRDGPRANVGGAEGSAALVRGGRRSPQPLAPQCHTLDRRGEQQRGLRAQPPRRAAGTA